MGWVVSTTPLLRYPWERDLVPTVHKAGCAPLSGQVRKISSPSLSFEPRTITSVASRYTD
jgi:hypothetical protein